LSRLDAFCYNQPVQATSNITQELVLVGGGHAHVAVLKRLGMHPLPGVRITLVSDASTSAYSGMLPGCIAGHYRREEAQIELRPLCRFAGAQFYQDVMIGLDLANKRVQFANRPPAGFDILSLNLGSTPQTVSAAGAARYSLPVKPVQAFLRRWEELAQQPAPASGKPRRLVVVGGGAGGVELLLATRHRLLQRAGPLAHNGSGWVFHLVTATDTILPTHNRSVQRRYQRILLERDVHVHVQHSVTEVTAEEVRCGTGAAISYDVLLWATQADAPAWLRESGLATDDKGFVKVNEFLQSTSHPFVFAAGDVAGMVQHPRPKSGVFAVRQGRPLAENLVRAISGQPLHPFTPQRQFLSLISTGDRYAVASRGPFACEGAWVWKLKDWIDRRWMRQYQELPEMSAPGFPSVPSVAPSPSVPAPPDQMRCGGCGAKIGADVLHRVLRRLQPVQREDVLIGLASPDDAAVVQVPAGQVAVQTVDFFRTFLNDPYVFGQVAANHGLGDIFAMGAEPQSALLIATVPPGAEPRVEEQLHQLLAGALRVLNAHETQLAGGHTAEGPELALGMVVNGLAHPDRLWRKGGLLPGQALILTKPIGTGALFAADMRGRAAGRWIETALSSMLLSHREAARILREHGATACTDVTGFGLVGHLLEMLGASSVSATIQLGKLPILDGAREVVAGGALSSLHPQNLRFERGLENQEEARAHGLFPLLFDPQTAGGLLAGVPAERGSACLESLRAAGYVHASLIGHVTPAGEQPRVMISR